MAMLDTAVLSTSMQTTATNRLGRILPTGADVQLLPVPLL